jgi:hypothetical protein
MKLHPRVFTLLLAAFLSSCGTATWSAADRAQLDSLAVPPAEVAADGYQKPIGNQVAAAPFVPVVNGGFVAGAAAGAVTQLAVEIGATIDQKAFESRYAGAIGQAAGTVPGDLSSRIRKSVAASLETLPSLRGRLRSSSPNRFVVKVDRYRYVHAGRRGDETLVTPAFEGSYELVTGGGKKLLSREFTAASAATHRTLNEFVASRALAAKAFDEAVADIARQAGEVVGGKLGETPGAAARGAGGAAASTPYQLSDMSGALATCSSPYRLTQSCNLWSGAARPIQVGGRKLRIAGSADGRIVLIKDAALLPGESVSSRGSSAYQAVKQALEAARVRILKQRDLTAPGGKMMGFFLETDGDAYRVLTRGS